MWQNGKKILGLWTINENRNAWVWVDTLGWRKLAHDDDSIFTSMLAVCTTAYHANRPVNFREVGVGGNIEIWEIYSW
jgi:hypothetical protein